MANSAFHAYLSNNLSNVTGDYTSYVIPWDSVRFDANGDINTSTGYFTAPANGIYRFSAAVCLKSLSSNNVSGMLLLNTSSGSYVLGYCDAYGESEKLTGEYRLSMSGTVLVEMSASDQAYISIQVDNGSKSNGIISGNFSNFCGELVA